ELRAQLPAALAEEVARSPSEERAEGAASARGARGRGNCSSPRSRAREGGEKLLAEEPGARSSMARTLDPVLRSRGPRPRRAARSARAQAVVLHLLLQHDAGEAEHLRRPRDVPALLAKDLGDVARLEGRPGAAERTPRRATRRLGVPAERRGRRRVRRRARAPSADLEG